ncbi:MAG TPA: helical backbone metal receptor [Croceibacterium sp.]|jgi:iron complex transport system substrate-binding protein
MLPKILPVPGRMGIAAAVGLLAGCGAQPAPSSAAHHPTIVSLNPCTDAILAEVTAPGQLLAITHYSHDPRATSMPLAEARRYRATGGTVEEVLALDPDIVVASSYLDPAAANAFRRLGIRVEAVGIAATVAQSEAQVRRLAALAGEPARGQALVARIDHAVAAAHRSGEGVTALVWQEGGLVPGPDTLVAQLLHNSGFASLSAARGLGQGAYLPLEQVLADPPRLVIAAGDERMEHHPALRHVKGVRYAAIAPNLLFCGGPTIPRLAARLTELRDGMGRPLPAAGGVWGGTDHRSLTDPPPAPSAGGRGVS